MRWKWILGIGVALVVAFIVTVYVILLSYDFNNLKPMIAQEVRDATGRELTLGGDIELKVGFVPAIVVEDVSLRNVPWGSRPELAKIGRLEVQVALFPLIGGNIHVKRFIVAGPDILVETDKSGRSNLEFKTAKRVEPAEPDEGVPSGGPKLPGLIFNKVLIEKGHLTYKDGRSGKSFEVSLDRLTASAKDMDSPIALDLNAAYNTKPLKVTGNLGPLVTLVDPHKAWPLRLKVESGGVTVTFEGTVRDAMKARGFDITFIAESQSISHMARLADVTGVPDVGPVKVAFEIKDTEAKTYTVSDLDVSLGDSDIAGSAEIQLADKRPRLTAALSSRKLDLRPFLSEGKATSGGAGEKVFPDDPLPFDTLKQTDAKLKIRAGQVLLPRMALNNLSVDMVLENGRLAVKPIKAVVGGGTLHGRLKLRPQGRGAALTTEMKIEKLNIGRMLKELELTDILEGKLDVDIKLSGRGGSIASLMAGLNGRTFTTMSKGRVKNKYIDLLGADFASGAMRLFDQSEGEADYTAFNCFVSCFDIKNGLAKSTALVFDTSRMTVVGEGEVNLKTEELDLSLKPSPKKGVAGVSLSLSELSKPFKLGGTLANPSLEIDTTQAAITLGKGIGGMVLFGPVGIAAALAGGTEDDENPCLTAIEAAKKGVKVSGDKEPKKKEEKGVTEKVTEGVKGAVEGIGSSLKKLFGN